jgi:hypothetical protein
VNGSALHASNPLAQWSPRPPLDHLCDADHPDLPPLSCLAWQRQVIGTCCRRGHGGVLCATCDEGWHKVSVALRDHSGDGVQW